jgi:acyl-CoA reductase-like NAD-dependent aldehyde dehydrogenase
MSLMTAETFGPVIGIQRVGSDDAAVEAMNDTEFGLTAAVFGADRRRAETILSRLDVGSAYWNCCDRVSPRLPWSGRGHSGMGVTLSETGIFAFLQPKAYHLRG